MVFGVWVALVSMAGYRTSDDSVSSAIPALVAMHELIRGEMLSTLSIGGFCDDEVTVTEPIDNASAHPAYICEIPARPSMMDAIAAGPPMTYDFRRPTLGETHAADDTGVAAALPFDPLEELKAAESTAFAESHAGLMPVEPDALDELDVESFDTALTAETVIAPEQASLGQSFHHFLNSSGTNDEEIQDFTHHLKSGETISQVLANVGVDRDEIREWVRAAQDVYNLNRVYVGQEISIRMDTRDRSMQRLSFETGRTSVLIAQRNDGGIDAELREIPHTRRLRVVGAEILSSLYMAAVAKGIPDQIISDIAEILGWEIDFAKDLHAGATFRVVFEELVRNDTDEAIPGRVLAVDVTNRGRSHEGFYFITPDGGRGGYYNRNGEALGRAFLRYPVKYSRISSHFSDARYHPILKTNIPHYGVDFAAPTGTPVQAVADGSVVMARWHRGNGRFVKLKHDSTYESGYAHLSRIAPGLKPGMRVRKGEVIGYVGMTGLATGPHLHFAMYRNGAYIDPLTSALPRARSLAGSTLAAYEMALGMIDHAYAQAGFGPEVVAQLSAPSVTAE